MQMADEITWIDPYAGFEYESDTVRIEAGYQSEKLRACGLEAELFGQSVDPSFYIGLAIHAGVNSGISAEGNVNMVQSLEQHRPAELGEVLTVRGRISAVNEVPRGRTIDSDVWFEDSQGERVITARRRSLKPDQTKTARGAGERPPPVLTDPAAATVLSTHQLTPEQVKAYSEEGNSIHYDLKAAQKAGFRAPLIGGGMGVHYLLAAIWKDDPPQKLSLDIYFRRPVFWDETFYVIVDVGGSGIGSGIGLARTDEASGTVKVLTEARIKERS
jgi:hypothetical protein